MLQSFEDLVRALDTRTKNTIGSNRELIVGASRENGVLTLNSNQHALLVAPRNDPVVPAFMQSAALSAHYLHPPNTSSVHVDTRLGHLSGWNEVRPMVIQGDRWKPQSSVRSLIQGDSDAALSGIARVDDPSMALAVLANDEAQGRGNRQAVGLFAEKNRILTDYMDHNNIAGDLGAILADAAQTPFVKYILHMTPEEVIKAGRGLQKFLSRLGIVFPFISDAALPQINRIQAGLPMDISPLKDASYYMAQSPKPIRSGVHYIGSGGQPARIDVLPPET